eukprot:1752210-Pyramimonas_sp.AAC.2
MRLLRAPSSIATFVHSEPPSGPRNGHRQGPARWPPPALDDLARRGGSDDEINGAFVCQIFTCGLRSGTLKQLVTRQSNSWGADAVCHRYSQHYRPTTHTWYARLLSQTKIMLHDINGVHGLLVGV